MRKRVGRLLGKGVCLRPGTRKKWKAMLRAWSWEGKWGQEGRDGVGSHSLFNMRKLTDWVSSWELPGARSFTQCHGFKWQRPLSPPKGERCRIKSTTG